jgi:hypothetical protein
MDVTGRLRETCLTRHQSRPHMYMHELRFTETLRKEQPTVACKYEGATLATVLELLLDNLILDAVLDCRN